MVGLRSHRLHLLPRVHAGGDTVNPYLTTRPAGRIYVFGFRWLSNLPLADPSPVGSCEANADSDGRKCGEPGYKVMVLFGPGSAVDSTSFSLEAILCPGHEMRARAEGASVRHRSRAEAFGRRLAGLQ